MATQNNQEWDETLNSAESEELLKKMEEDALKDFDLGNLKPMDE